MFGRIYLDSNIFISALGGDAEVAQSRLLIELIGSVGPTRATPFVTSELSLAECLVRSLRLGRDDQSPTFDNILTTSGWLEVCPVSRAILLWSALVRSQHPGMKLPDAIHVATAISTECDTILTADRGLKGTYLLEDNRWRQSGRSKLLTVARPDESTLQAMIDWLRT